MRTRSIARSIAVLGAAGLVAVATTAAAQSPEEQCSNQAWVSCQTDENGNPTFVTVECYEREYQACIDAYGGRSLGAYRD